MATSSAAPAFWRGRGPRLSLRAKILVVLAACMTVAIGCFYAVGSVQVMDGFLQLERTSAEQDAGRAVDALNQEVSAIDTTILSFSSWDDTYAYIDDHNDAYVDSNLGDAVFEQLDATIIAYVDSSGSIVWAKAADRGNVSQTLPEGFAPYLAPGSVLLDHPDIAQPAKGLLSLPGGPMLVVSRPILTSDGTGPSKGSLIIGRSLDAAHVAALGDLTHQKMSIWTLGTAVPGDVKTALKSLDASHPAWTQPVSDETIAAYRLVNDLGGKPAFVLEVELPRTIYAQGNSTLRTFLLLLPLFAVAIVVTLLLALERIVVRPLRRLTVTAERVALGDVTIYVDGTDRDDEVGAVARAFGGTVDYLRATAQAADRVARGDLTEQIDPRSDKDDLGLALARMVENLRALLGQVADTTARVKEVATMLSVNANEVRQAVGQVAQTVTQVAGGAQEQARGVGETSAAMGQLDRLIAQVRDGATRTVAQTDDAEGALGRLSETFQGTFAAAKEVERVSASAADAAQGGSAAVRESVEGMSRIDAVVRNASTKVIELGQKGQQIGIIVEKIDEIADQTNLLALNAAIEAARAGEQGKGFAVVADEIRKLAEKSSRATKEIASLVAEVRRETEEAVAAMQAGGAEVQRGTELAAHSGRAIEELGAAVDATRRAADAITQRIVVMSDAAGGVFGSIEEIARIADDNRGEAVSMTEQSVRVTDSLESIAAVSEENSAAAQEVSAATEQMSAQASEFVVSAGSLVEAAEQLAEFAAQFQLETELDARPAAPPASVAGRRPSRHRAA